MNQTTIMGHLGADPVVRYTSSGQKVTTLRVACNQRRSGKDETLWWRVTIWGEQFDKMMPYLKKGGAVIISGEMLKPEIYTNKEGQPQVSLNLVAFHLAFSPFGKSQDASPAQEKGTYMAQEGREQPSMQQGQGEESHAHDFAEDEIPF